MGLNDYWNSTYYILGEAASLTKNVGVSVLKSTGVIKSEKTPEFHLPPNLQNLDVSKFVHCGSMSVKVAAFSGAMAVVLGAYGAHTLNPKENYDERKLTFETANRYHFFHTLALFGAPLSRNPKLTASFMGLGMLLFCGTCYYQAFTNNKSLRKLTPIGGTFLILGWLSMVF